MIDDRQERKLGGKVLAAMSEMAELPRDEIERFAVLVRQLRRAVAAYKEYTGSDTLLHGVEAYGYHV